MKDFQLSKVVADPEPCPLPLKKSSFPEIIYCRLHGTPEIYKSDYEENRLQEWAHHFDKLPDRPPHIWYIFDNTTFGYATKNALELKTVLGEHSPSL